MTVIPLVVSLLITGMASASDVKSIGRLGGRTLVVFIGPRSRGSRQSSCRSRLLCSRTAPSQNGTKQLPAGAADAAAQIATGGQAQTFGAWLTSLIPTNPIAAAAANGQMVSLIIFTILLALAIAKSTPAARNRTRWIFPGTRRCDADSRALGRPRCADRDICARASARRACGGVARGRDRILYRRVHGDQSGDDAAAVSDRRRRRRRFRSAPSRARRCRRS